MQARTMLLFLLAACGAARAQDLPARPMRLVSIFAPGSASDMHGRCIAQTMGVTAEQRSSSLPQTPNSKRLNIMARY